jgi:glutathione synthase/RimK-type ligase-like ATP-grasp enzyme
MILVITNKNDAHVDYIIPNLKKRGANVLRINTEDFPRKNSINIALADGYHNFTLLTIFGNTDISSICSVWYRRPGKPEPSFAIANEEYIKFFYNETQEVLNALYLLVDCLWVNHPNDIRLSDNKIYQLVQAKKLGFNIPNTIVTTNPEIAKDFIASSKNSVIIKPLKYIILNGYSNQKNKTIYTSLVSSGEMDFLEEIKLCPVLMQENIIKDIELRVTVIGEKVFTAAIQSQKSDITRIDWRKGINKFVLEYSVYNLPENIEQLCISLVRSMNLKFGAIDIIKTHAGEYIFLEINPNGQWLWIELATGMPIGDSLVDLLLSNNSK